MKTITLDKAIEILTSCAAVIVDGSYVTFPNITDEDYEDEKDVFLKLAVSEGDDEELFTTQDNETVKVNDSGELYLMNPKGEQTIIMPLVAAPVQV